MIVKIVNNSIEKIRGFDTKYDRNYQINIIFETNSLLIINKPFDVRIDGNVQSNGLTIEHLLYKYYQEKQEDVAKLYLIHQLDYSTSGIHLWGKNKAITGNLNQKFMKRTMKKTYCAILVGWVEQDEMIIDQPITKHFKDWPKKMMIDSNGSNGKPSKTKLTVLKRGYYLGSLFKVSLAQLEPETGRRHQLRLHTNYIGHSILGDYNYEVPFTNCYRMMLHSWKLYIPDIPTKILELNDNNCKEEEFIDLDIQFDSNFHDLIFDEIIENHFPINYDFENNCLKTGFKFDQDIKNQEVWNVPLINQYLTFADH
jgi:RluA family pseudouridine synthase